MLKKKKKGNPTLGDIYAILLKNNTWTLSQLYYTKEVEGYYSTTFAFFDSQFSSKEELEDKLDSLLLNQPIMIFTITEQPLKNKEWILIGNRSIQYDNFDFSNVTISNWGWFDNTERDINWILEMYFGIYPWDSFKDKDFMNKLLLSNQEIPAHARYLNSFTEKELKDLGIDMYIQSLRGKS